MSASWLAVHLVEAPERTVLVNAGKIAAIGADVVVTGSAVFDGKSPMENAAFMLDALKTRPGKGRTAQ